jgi:inorganic pyrophosphatase
MGMFQQISSFGAVVLLVWASVYQLAAPEVQSNQSPPAKNAATKRWIHPFDIPQTKSFPDEVMAVIEIAQGSFTKYEIDPDSGLVAVDRFQSMPVVYPANYGVITSSLAGDGDNLDVLVLSREPIVPGALIKIRPVGLLRMIDGGEEDDKVIAVPASAVDPTYDAVLTIADLPAIEIQRIEAFFRVYKQLPQGRKVVELNGFVEAAEAKALIDKAIKRYQSLSEKE